MTTIACRHGIIATDTQSEASGWIVPGKVDKIRRIDHETVAAITGERERFEPWLAWYAGDRSEPHDLGENSSIIVAHAGGGVTVYQGKGWFRHDGTFGAWGSGWPAAVAAMHMGADAKRAIEIAALCDPSTGCDVVAMPIREPSAMAA